MGEKALFTVRAVNHCGKWKTTESNPDTWGTGHRIQPSDS